VSEVKYRGEDTALNAAATFWPRGEAMNFVGGQWTSTQARVEVLDPSTARPFASAPDSDRAEVAAAVATAASSQPRWARLDLSERVDALTALRAALLAQGEQLALLESVDSGNPMSSTRRDVELAAKYLSVWPSYAYAFTGRMTSPVPDGFSYTLHKPYGVVGKIVAFNHPALFAIIGMIMPLLAGNTVVIKASPQAPLATLALGRFIAETLPAGVVNLVAGGAAAGDALVTHDRIKRLAFVGSLPTALTIQSRAAASGSLKHLSFELGGKNAMIVFPDADLDAAVEAAFAGMSFTVSAGQSCQSTSRLLLHDSIAEDFTASLADRMRAVRVGTAYHPDSDMGPLVSAAHLQRVQAFVASGRDAGARLVTGGTAPDAPGYFLNPTLFSDVTPDMDIARDEIFGPVLSTFGWSDYDQMLSMANGLNVGLSAAIWTRDIDLALRTAADVDAGYIWVNDANRHYLGAPFGGVKDSGTGREETAEEYATYLETSAVNVKVTTKPRVRAHH
jgi:acyl-CoA reductase-like NAD-dependent aldehyde dehydrogenase